MLDGERWLLIEKALKEVFLMVVDQRKSPTLQEAHQNQMVGLKECLSPSAIPQKTLRYPWDLMGTLLKAKGGQRMLVDER